MTGPSTAAELLHLAAGEVQDLLDVTERYRPDPAGLAAGWPAFLRAAQHLNSAIRPDHPGGWALTARVYGLVTGPVPAGQPDRHLERAASLLAAAGDVIGSRDRRGLSPEQLRADEAQVAPTLVAVAHLVGQATLHHPDLQPAFASAFGAVSAWSCFLPAWGQGRGSGSLQDASTLVSRPTPTLADLPGLLEVAVHDWQWAALAAAARTAPSSEDLQTSARTASGLLAVSQVLLWAHTDTDTGSIASDSAVRTITALRAASAQWRSAAGNWRSITTAVPASQDLLLAGVAVDTTIRLLGRTEDRWASAQDVRGRAEPAAALAAARSALAAVQAVAEQHTPLVGRLAQAGGLYAPARQLTPGEDRISARLNNKWIQLGKSESVALTEAYRQLPAVTATARALFTATTSPATAQTPRPALTATGRHADRNPQPRTSDRTGTVADPADAAPTTLAGQTWHRTCTELDPRLTSDPHYPVLAAALDRIALTGANVTAVLAEAVAGASLPPEHTARALHYQLLDVCPAAVIPYTDVFTARAAPSRPSPPPPSLARSQPAPIRGPAR